MKAINELSLVLNDYAISNINAVATSVIRESVNSKLFTDAASEIIGTDIEVISCSKGAELTAIGILKSINHISNKKLIVDIGGGSTEFAVVDGSNYISSLVSIKFGIVNTNRNI